MSEWTTDELRDQCHNYRTEELNQIGMILTHDKKGELVRWKLRYGPLP